MPVWCDIEVQSWFQDYKKPGSCPKRKVVFQEGKGVYSEGMPELRKGSVSKADAQPGASPASQT